MSSNYWIKLYHEILDDPKMGRLFDGRRVDNWQAEVK